MRNKSQELINERQNEILVACAKLYEKKGFKDVSIKDISEYTSFSRPSIYNYYQTKEEIFLGLLMREFKLLTSDLQYITQEIEYLSKNGLAKEIARALAKREILLKILSSNMVEIEEHSRNENLMQYQSVFQECMQAFDGCCLRFLINYDEKKLALVHHALLPFMYGIYPNVKMSQKRIMAMKSMNLNISKLDIYDMSYDFLMLVL